MMYLILRSASTGLEPSFHTTQEGLTKLASKMIYLKSGISQHCLKQRLNADNHCRRQFTLAQRLHLLSLHKTPPPWATATAAASGSTSAAVTPSSATIRCRLGCAFWHMMHAPDASLFMKVQ
jgi:hypothetical protein